MHLRTSISLDFNDGKKKACCRFVFILLLILQGMAVVLGKEGQPANSSPKKVTLRWNFKTGQVFSGKIATQIQTIDDNPKTTSTVWEYRWEVQDLTEDGRAVVNVILDREKFQHRSDKVTVDYDSNNDEVLQPSDPALTEIQNFLNMIRRMHAVEFPFVFSDRGKIWEPQAYEFELGQSIFWPELPEDPVGVGDTWTSGADADNEEIYVLAKLEEIEGQTVAVIECKSDTSRFRFLVNEGRYVDRVQWDIIQVGAQPNESYIQSYSQRWRLDLAGVHERFDRWPGLQPNQPGRAMNLIARSYRHASEIREYLQNEQSFLTRILNGLFIEHVENMDFPNSNPQWAPIDWLMTARYYERTGDDERYRQLLLDGVVHTAAQSHHADGRQDIYLLQFVDLLAGIGEFAAAKKACLEISPEALVGVNFTASGVVQVPKSSMRFYGLLTVAREQAMLGLSEEAISTARLIDSPPYRSAAHWIVAMHLAERGELESAITNVGLAVEQHSEDATIIEFDTKGPAEVAVRSFRTLALGKLAMCQAKTGDEHGMRKTVAMIEDPTERTAAYIYLITALDKEGQPGIVDKLSKELPQSPQSMEIALRIAMRLQSQDFKDVETMIESIGDSAWRAACRLNYCLTLTRENGRTDKLQSQLDLARETIQEISNPLNRISALIEYAKVLLESERQDEANTQLMMAFELVKKESLKSAQKLELQFQIAKLLAGIDGTEGFDDVMSGIESTLNSMVDREKRSYQLSMVQAYLRKDDTETAKSIAEKIVDSSLRCQALAAVGRRYAQLLELESSREVFAKAFASAMQVIDTEGLDTVSSKGGALRFVAQKQGEYDLEGLVKFAEDSSDPNILAYAYLGAAESIDPNAAAAAGKIGRLPLAVLKDVCESNLMCDLMDLLKQRAINLPPVRLNQKN